MCVRSLKKQKRGLYAYAFRMKGATSPGGIAVASAVDAPVLGAAVSPSPLETIIKAVAPMPSATIRIKDPTSGGVHHL